MSQRTGWQIGSAAGILEVPQAYQDASHVVGVVHYAGIALTVAQLWLLGVIIRMSICNPAVL